MNIRKRLEHLSMLSAKDRARGRTTAIAKAAKEIDAILLVASFQESTRLQRENPGLVARSIDINMDGYHGPFLFDHFAIEVLLNKAAHKIDDLEKSNTILLNAKETHWKNYQEEHEKWLKERDIRRDMMDFIFNLDTKESREFLQRLGYLPSDGKGDTL